MMLLESAERISERGPERKIGRNMVKDAVPVVSTSLPVPIMLRPHRNPRMTLVGVKQVGRSLPGAKQAFRHLVFTCERREMHFVRCKSKSGGTAVICTIMRYPHSFRI